MYKRTNKMKGACKVWIEMEDKMVLITLCLIEKNVSEVSIEERAFERCMTLSK